jgi:protein CpxP
MKSKRLPILLLLLLLLNGVLIFMLVKKPHERLNQHSERNFLTEQLQFSKAQIIQFKELDTFHRNAMLIFEKKIKEQKDILFNSFHIANFNSDSIAKKIGLLEGNKEAEVFLFFNKVRTLCTLEQVKKFDEIINEALRGGEKRRPPNEGNMPPPPSE